jgi:ubiquinone/menaquinone biosynthesis C-methylase UbiE
MVTLAQDKQKEVAFFDGHAAMDAYDVFTPETNARLITSCAQLAGFRTGTRVADLGCGSGVFTDLLHRQGYDAVGLDLSPKLIGLARQKYPGVEFLEGDVEHLPFPDSSLDSGRHGLHFGSQLSLSCIVRIALAAAGLQCA